MMDRNKELKFEFGEAIKERNKEYRDNYKKRERSKSLRNKKKQEFRNFIICMSALAVLIMVIGVSTLIHAESSAKSSSEEIIEEVEIITESINETESFSKIRISNTDDYMVLSDAEVESKKDNYKVFSTVNVREYPSEEATIIVKLDKDSYCTVINVRDDGWSEVLIAKRIYYVKTMYIGNTIEEYQDYLEQKKLTEESIAESLAVEQSLAEAAKDKTPYSDYLVNEWGFSYDLQKYLWDEVCAYTSDENMQKQYYCFLLAVIQQESKFGKYDNNKNSNGTIDSGIMQVNSCNWKTLKNAGIITSYENGRCDELSNDDYIAIEAGMYFMNKIIDKLGVCEGAYYRYNVGHGSGSNNNSKKVWGYYQEWYSLLYNESV